MLVASSSNHEGPIRHPAQTVPLPSVHRIAIQGEPGSNSHMAALAVAPAAEILPCAAAAEVFEALSSGRAARAVLPIENSLHGSVFEHNDLLLEHEAHVIGETLLRIRHHVIAAPGVTLAQLRTIGSHPVALSQCRRWLRDHPSLQVVPAYDTAGSVKQLMASGSRDHAGIAPEMAAQVYGAQILVRDIEDHAENYTRFLVLAAETQAEPDPEADKMSLAFTLQHRPGSLVAALASLERTGVNLTRIESRPVPGRPWEYVFFVDLRFTTQPQGDWALASLSQTCERLHLLGRYRAAN